MNRPRRKAIVTPDQPTLQAWEDMRIETLHEMQEGASPPDEMVEVTAEVTAASAPLSAKGKTQRKEGHPPEA